MSLRQALFLGARAGFVLFFVLTATYCVLAYVPFAYIQFIGDGLVPWVSTFASLHTWLYWAAAGLAAATLVPDLLRSRTRALTIGFLAGAGAVGVLLFVRPAPTWIRNDSSSVVAFSAALVPILGVAVIDWVASARDVAWSSSEAGEDRRLFRAAVLSGVFLALVYAGGFYLRFVRSGTVEFGGSRPLVAVAWSLAGHLLLFMALFTSLALVRGISALSARAARVEFWLAALLAALLGTLALRKLVFAAISFTGPDAWFFAGAVAGCLTASLAGVALRTASRARATVDSGIGLFLEPLTGGLRLVSWPARILWLAAIAAASSAAAAWAAPLDWNFLLQKLTALALWALTFAGFYAMWPRRDAPRDRLAALLLAPVVCLGVYRALWAAPGHVAALGGDPALDVSATLDRYAAYEVSYKVIHEMLAPRATEDPTFYDFLQRHTNISRETKIEPIEIDLVPALAETRGEKPNIFVFVIDSLRRDYLAPYNAGVVFTPEIDRFAAESVVFTNAFTRYGATGLAEPSIWVGGMMPHRQYVTPFYPMNVLQKLIEAERYRAYVSIDSILRIIVEPSPSIVDLGEGVPNGDGGFCRSLRTLRDEIHLAGDDDRPVFAYTQPQDIHVSVIARERASVPPGESYPGFHAPTASRIRRMDACFGEFVRFLKERGLYDSSIVILTSDHGDSLGEEGRWGHAYTLFPEIIRIPLIVHLPPRLRDGVEFDPDAIAFSTDITPTLYGLLGHRPTLESDVMGRPLFGSSPAQRAAGRRRDYLLASSYGPVYGILGDGGTSLYIVDGINYVDYVYDLRAGAMGTKGRVSAGMRAEYARRIREAILEIHRFYKLRPLQ